MVNYFLWDRDYNGKCEVHNYYKGRLLGKPQFRFLQEKHLNVFIRYNQAISILKKVLGKNEESFSKFVSFRNPFGLPSNLNGFSKISQDGYVKVYLSKGITGFIPRSNILKNVTRIDQFKLFVPKAFGTGNSFDDKLKPIQGNYNTCCTESFLVIGPFYSNDEMANVMSYINSKFFHFLLSLIKNTQNTTQQSYKFIPIQDFSCSWNDVKLFTKYNLNQLEIKFIKKMVW